MFYLKTKKELTAIQWALGWHNGGVYKRIDEGRELLYLLRTKSPSFLDEHPWVENWVKSTDEFLVYLSQATSIPSGRFLKKTGFPRPLPTTTPHEIKKDLLEG